MKTLPALAQVVGQSHRRLVHVDLWRCEAGAVDTRIGRLPVSDGRITAQARPGRWTGSITVAGAQWAPATFADPLAGFVPHYVRVYAGAQVDTVDRMVELCKLLVRGSRVSRTPDGVDVEVDLVGLDSWVLGAADYRYTPEIGLSVQDAIAALYRARRPAGWRLTVDDRTTAPVAVPVGFSADAGRQPVGSLLADLEAIGNVTSYVDALGRLVIRDPLPATAGVPVRALSVTTDVTGYTVDIGRDLAFANKVTVTYEAVAATRKEQRRFAADWDRVTTADPAAGQFRLSGTSLRVGYVDKRGKRRRKRQLEATQAGDLVSLAFTGVTVVYEVQSVTSNDTKDYADFTVTEVDRDPEAGNPPATEVNVEVAFFSPPDKPRVGTATKTDGPLGTATVGLVEYAETRVGNVTQAQADARAKATLGVMLRGAAAVTLTCVPDMRLEPDDDVTVTYADGQTLPHRVAAVDIPLGVGDMQLELQTFDLATIPTVEA